MTNNFQAPAEGDGMLKPLIYAAMMHNGKPKTVAEFERAAANVADMLERRAIAQPLPEALPHPGSPEADKMLDALLAEYGQPVNMKNAARAGYMAARRLLQHARQPLPATDDAEPNVQPKGIPVAWSRQQFICDDAGYSIGTDEPELYWGKEPPDNEAGWHPLYAAEGVTTRDAALEEAAQLCERWNTTPGRKLAGEVRALAAQAPAPAPEVAAAPRPFNAVKSFADSVLAMLDERIKAVDQAAHPFNDYFGDQPDTIVAAKAQAGELREVRTQVRILTDRALVELVKFRPAISAPAVQDVVRLDYIQRIGATVSLCPGSPPEPWKDFKFMVGGYLSSVNRDLRAAIDEAMRVNSLRDEAQPPVQGLND